MFYMHQQNYSIPSTFLFISFLTYLLCYCITTNFALSWDSDQANPFREKIVHFDLKGAPPTLNYYREMFPLLKEMEVNGILMEYEDMFPYRSELSVLKRTISYSETVLEAILQLASENNVEVVPLVQTFGHMEFVLKHPKYSVYREDILKHDTICPSDEGSWRLITEMLKQVRIMHPNAKRIHIGADEAYTVGKDIRCMKRCERNLNFCTDRLKLSHISRVARYARSELGFAEVLVWNDMFGHIGVDLLHEYQMGELVIPVIWGYAVDVTELNYFPTNMFHRYSQVFSKMMFGSAFKGANGQKESFCDIRRYLANHRSYVDLYKKENQDLDGKISGIILTGWQRYSHYSPLCEILPVAIPSLIVNLVYLNDVELCEDQIMQKDILNCRNTTALFPVKKVVTGMNSTAWNNEVPLEMMFTNCSFPGSEIYDEMAKFHWCTAEKKDVVVILQKIRENVRKDKAVC